MMMFPPPGRPQAVAADIEARRKAFQHLRHQLGMTAAEIAQLTGLAHGTVRNYFAPHNPAHAATWRTIRIMREEAMRRAKVSVMAARERLADAETMLRDLEKEAA